MANGHKQATQLQPRGRRSSSAPYLRPVLVALILLVVLGGIRAARPAVAGTGPLRQDTLPLAAGFELVMAVLLVALWLISRRGPGYPAAVLRRGLLQAIVLAMVAVAVLAGLSRLNPHLRRRPHLPVASAPPKPGRPRIARGVGAHSSLHLAYVFYVVLALLVLAAIVACVLLMLRWTPSRLADNVTMIPDDDDANMRDAVESGRRALRSFDDAQAAIIACYVAMETSLARAGTARAAAETPDELLARAVASGVLHGTAAGQLTALFYEARYSSHTLPPTARDEAGRALDLISAELAGRAAEDQGSRMSAGGAAS